MVSKPNRWHVVKDENTSPFLGENIQNYIFYTKIRKSIIISIITNKQNNTTNILDEIGSKMIDSAWFSIFQYIFQHLNCIVSGEKKCFKNNIVPDATIKAIDNEYNNTSKVL